jgi:hypothetical protein
VMCDFEAASYESFSIVFESVHFGCYFHLTQMIRGVFEKNRTGKFETVRKRLNLPWNHLLSFNQSFKLVEILVPSETNESFKLLKRVV